MTWTTSARVLNSCTASHVFFNKRGPLLDNTTNCTDSTLKAVGITLPFHVSGWRSQRKRKRKNKTWLWTRPLKQKRKKSPHRLLRLSPNWRHGPLQDFSPNRKVTKGNRKKKHFIQSTGHRTNHLLPWSLLLLFPDWITDVNTSVCWLRLVCLLLQCLGCMMDSCKYFVKYILLFFLFHVWPLFHLPALKHKHSAL